MVGYLPLKRTVVHPEDLKESNYTKIQGTELYLDQNFYMCSYLFLVHSINIDIW